jgi:hypothetical protein
MTGQFFTPIEQVSPPSLVFGVRFCDIHSVFPPAFGVRVFDNIYALATAHHEEQKWQKCERSEQTAGTVSLRLHKKNISPFSC